MEGRYKFIGIEHIPEGAREQVEKLLVTHSEKMNSHTQEPVEVILHCKEYSKDGSKHKYSIHGRVEGPGFNAINAESVNWDPKNAVHDVLMQLERQIDKRK
jgi:ribosome-associated translation inhibitor RaiA